MFVGHYFVMEIEVLENIGLTPAEAKVYLALLEMGGVSAKFILDKTGLHNSVVHNSLNRLIEKGFVSFVKEGKKNIYQASNPKHVIDFIDAKKERFESILPSLLAKQGMNVDKPEVTSFRGVCGVKELLLELLDAGGSEHHTIGSSSKSLMLGEAWWVDYHVKRVKKKISAKLLFNESLRAWGAEQKYKFSEVRYSESGFEPLTETIIRNDSVGIILWTEKPFGILVHNKELADSYETYFKHLWSEGKK